MRALPVQFIPIRGGLILKRGRTELWIAGSRALEVVPAVWKRASERDITREELAESFPEPERPVIRQFLDEMAHRRLLVPASEAAHALETLESTEDVFYWHFGARTVDVRGAALHTRIAILGVNCVSRQLALSLAEAGFDQVDTVQYPFLCNLRLFDEHGKLSEWPAKLKPPVDSREWEQGLEQQGLDCLVATSDFGGMHLMRPWNERCVRNGLHFLPVVLQDMIGYLGPLVVPGETSCFECLRARQNSTLADPEFARASEQLAFEGQRVNGFHPLMASSLGTLAALELSRFYGGWALPRAAGTLLEVNWLETEMKARKVLKLPRCTVCGILNDHSPIALGLNAFLPIDSPPHAHDETTT